MQSKRAPGTGARMHCQADASVGADGLDRRLGLGPGLVNAVADHHGGAGRRLLVDHDALLVWVPHDVKLVDRQRRDGKRNRERARYHVFEHDIILHCAPGNAGPLIWFPRTWLSNTEPWRLWDAGARCSIQSTMNRSVEHVRHVQDVVA